MYPRNVIIKDVEFNWCKLAKPVTNQFGATQYEMQIVAKDKAHADQISKETGLSFKEKDGKLMLNLKRKASKKDGSDNGAPRVVDSNKAPIENPASVGNGSRGNVIVWQYEYSFGGSKGIGNSLTAVQVTKLEVYENKNAVDFDSVSEEAPKPASAELF